MPCVGQVPALARFADHAEVFDLEELKAGNNGRRLDINAARTS